MPCLGDNTGTTGFDAHYLYHTSWVARVLAANPPQSHIDIGSCLRFATLVSAFVPTSFYDYRPAQIYLSNLNCGYADLLSLPFADKSVQSLSCMHVVEHIGLERYGEPFDPKGDLRAIGELQRVLAKGGRLLFVVPVGEKPRIQYNAHRIYSFRQIIDYFTELKLEDFALITDAGAFIEHASQDDIASQMYACGCFSFTR